MADKFADRYTAAPGAYKRHMDAKAEAIHVAGRTLQAVGSVVAVGGTAAAITGIATLPGVLAAGAGVGLGAIGKQRVDVARNHRNVGYAVDDLAKRGKAMGNGPQRLSGAQAQEFAVQNEHYDHSHMGAPQPAAGKRGWANPVVQAAAKRAQGKTYNGPQD